MQTWALFVFQFALVANAARRPSTESSGYDGNNWPASLVIDTSNLPDASSQHDQFYGGGPARSAFDRDEEKATTIDQRESTTQSSRQKSPQTTSSTASSRQHHRDQLSTTQTPRPEFTPTSTTTDRFGGQHHFASSTNRPIQIDESRDEDRQTTVSQQFDGYGEQRAQPSGRPRQSWYSADGFDNRRAGQANPRQDQRRPLASNDYDSPRFQASTDQNRENSGFNRDSDNQRLPSSQRGDTGIDERFSSQQGRRENLPTTKSHHFDDRNEEETQNRNLPAINEQRDYEPQWSSSRDSGRQRVATPSGYDVNRDFNIDNSNRRTQKPQQQSMNEYESQASFSSSRDTGLVIEPTSRRPPSPVNEQQARLVAKLLNIDRLAGYSFGAEDSRPETVERNVTDVFPPPSPFNGTDVANATTANEMREINEILTRPLNASDQPFEDKNLHQTTLLEVLKLLHDEPQLRQQQKSEEKESVKVGKKVRIIKLPPMSDENESEEIVLVSEKGNATIHRGRNMFIQMTSNQKRRV